GDHTVCSERDSDENASGDTPTRGAMPGHHHRHQLRTSPTLAAKIAPVVIHPKILRARLLTCAPIILRLFVISMISSRRGGVEKPCTMPDHTSAFMGLTPRKFRPTAMRVTSTMTA